MLLRNLGFRSVGFRVQLRVWRFRFRVSGSRVVRFQGLSVSRPPPPPPIALMEHGSFKNARLKALCGDGSLPSSSSLSSSSLDVAEDEDILVTAKPRPSTWRTQSEWATRRTTSKKQDKPVPWTKTHEVFAEQLTQIQWGPSTVEEDELKLLEESPPLHPPPTTPPSPFTYEELMTVMRGLKANKAPGLDGMKAEALLLLDYVGERILLDLLNECFTTRTVPQEWKQALVVNIYKGKGSPANYRPISLLNVLYKIYAALLQRRLAPAHDHHLRSTQFGFRARRSTAEPSFIIRRLQDYSAKTGHPCHILFLDWKQAFDKVNHKSLLIALRRLGVHPHYLDIIRE